MVRLASAVLLCMATHAAAKAPIPVPRHVGFLTGDKNEENERLPTPEQVQRRREKGENPAARPATKPPTEPPATTEEPTTQAPVLEAEGQEATITPRHMSHDDTSAHEVNWEHFKARPLYFMFLLFMVLLPQCCLVGCCAFFYAKKIMDPRELGARPEEQTEGFSTSLFHCHKDLNICFWSFCCPGIRWADTTAKMRFMDTFWKGLIVWLVATFFCQLTTVIGFGLLFWLGFCVYLALFRQQMRKSFKMEDKSNVVVDSCIYYWCSCCAIAQEARHIKEHAQDEDPVTEPETKNMVTEPETKKVVTEHVAKLS